MLWDRYGLQSSQYTYSSGLENTKILERSNNSFAIIGEQLNKHNDYVDSEDSIIGAMELEGILGEKYGYDSSVEYKGHE